MSLQCSLILLQKLIFQMYLTYICIIHLNDTIWVNKTAQIGNISLQRIFISFLWYIGLISAALNHPIKIMHSIKNVLFAFQIFNQSLLKKSFLFIQNDKRGTRKAVLIHRNNHKLL